MSLEGFDHTVNQVSETKGPGSVVNQDPDRFARPGQRLEPVPD